MDVSYSNAADENVPTNNTLCEPTDGQWDDFQKVSWWVQGLVATILSSIGFFLNCAAGLIFTFTKPNDSSSAAFNRQLLCLSLFDNLYLLIGISEAIRNHFTSHTYYYDYAFTAWLYPLRSISMFCSMYTTLILSMVRYNSIKNPLAHLVQARLEASVSCCKDVKYIFLVIMAAVLFYLPKFFEFEITYNDDLCPDVNITDNETNCTNFEYQINDKYIRRNKDYVLWYMNVSNIIVTIIIPFVLLLYLNSEIHKEMKRFRKRQAMFHARRSTIPLAKTPVSRCQQRNNNEQTIIIFSLVAMFFCGHIFRAVLNVQELIYFDWTTKELAKGCHGVKFWAMILVPVSEVMLLANSSANFFIYYLFHNDFRNVIKYQYDKIRCYIVSKFESSEHIVIADKNGVQQPFIGASTIDTTIAQTGKENIEMNEIQSTFV